MNRPTALLGLSALNCCHSFNDVTLWLDCKFYFHVCNYIVIRLVGLLILIYLHLFHYRYWIHAQHNGRRCRHVPVPVVNMDDHLSSPWATRDTPRFMCSWPHPYSNLILGVFPLHQIAHVGASERMGLKLFGREIIFEEFQPMWSRYLNVTDRQMDAHLNLSLNAIS